MSKSFDSRWTMTSAKLGGFLWATLAVLVLSGKASLGVVELLFLLAPLVVVPLGFEVLDRYDHGMEPRAFGRAVRLLQPLGALLAVVSFWFAPGVVAGALTSMWLGVAALTAWRALLDLSRPGWQALDRMVFNIARVDLAIAAGWFVTSRLGLSPMGFQEPIVLLTGVHFHYSGFATVLIAGATLKLCAKRKGSAPKLASGIVVAVALVPFLVAAGFVLSPMLKMISALFLALALLGFAILQFWAAGHFTSTISRALLRVSAGLLVPGMFLVPVYAIGEYTGSYWLSISQMAHVHGPLNGPGFVLVTMLAWVLESLYPVREPAIRVGSVSLSNVGRTL